MRSTRGSRYTAVRPTLAEVVLKMPRGAQVIYPKDLGPILILADIFPGARVFEAGRRRRRPVDDPAAGRGRHHRLRAAARTSPTGPRTNVVAFLGAEALSAVPGRGPRRLRRDRRGRPRPDRARPARALAGGQGRRDGPAPGRDPGVLPSDDRAGRPAPRDARSQRLRHGRDDRGAAAQLARRGPVGAPRSPHGRPHRLPDVGPPAPGPRWRRHRRTRPHPAGIRTDLE